MTMYPAEYKYTREHEWIHVNGGTATIGITEFAQKQLGDVVFVELPEVGRTVETGRDFGTVESVKAVSELFMPVGGKVIEVNADLNDEPELLNSEPYEAWMIKIEVSDKAALKGLLSADQYEKYVASEAE
ncbi:glycine cleavage system protein GcvH [Streptomyces sp. NPDC048179]|uniref:glycine cleavage system protein GcvH n=1 Tax=Streptomyces sp. NPDC048179 TaxID=3365506 RepID=UPI0037189673